MTSLPDPQSRPAFVVSGLVNTTVPQNAQGFPCEVNDYVVHPPDWANDVPIANQRTVRATLTHNNGRWRRRCFVCDLGLRDCPGGVCVRLWHNYRERTNYLQTFASESSYILVYIS